MFIEKWKDTAFGTDYGGDFKDLLEELPESKLTLVSIFERCDLKKYFDQPHLVRQQTDNNVKIVNKDFVQFIHYEDAFIALSAVVVESELNGSADLKEAYGSKNLVISITKPELIILRNALVEIHKYPERFILFEMIQGEEKDIVLSDITEIIDGLAECIAKK